MSCKPAFPCRCGQVKSIHGVGTGPKKRESREAAISLMRLQKVRSDSNIKSQARFRRRLCLINAEIGQVSPSTKTPG
jgi:hypothetical protein